MKLLVVTAVNRGIVERLIQPKATEGFKENLRKYTASLAGLFKSGKNWAQMSTLVLFKISRPVVITSVQIENIDFSSSI